jgi:hypothetical protein
VVPPGGAPAAPTRLHGADRRLLLVSWILLGVARALTAVLPFRVVRHLLGEPQDGFVGTPDEPAPLSTDAEQRGRAWRIGVLIGRAAARTPWRADCYPQALTARALLGLAGIPHRVTFGVRRDAGRLVAHAWVDVDGVPVTGGDGRDWTAVGSFAWSRSPGGRSHAALQLLRARRRERPRPS